VKENSTLLNSQEQNGEEEMDNLSTMHKCGSGFIVEKIDDVNTTVTYFLQLEDGNWSSEVLYWFLTLLGLTFSHDPNPVENAAIPATFLPQWIYSHSKEAKGLRLRVIFCPE
jgi:hypothetical protein